MAREKIFQFKIKAVASPIGCVVYGKSDEKS
jgi:hypothetical protein